MKKRKLFLLPGLAASVLLMIFMWNFLYVNHFRKLTLIIVPEKFPDWLPPIPYTTFRNYHNIHYTGKDLQDNIKLEYARIRIAEIIQQNDTINGLHFTFSDSAKVNIFIHTLDVLKQENAQRYAIDRGEIWFYEEPFEPQAFDGNDKLKVIEL